MPPLDGPCRQTRVLLNLDKTFRRRPATFSAETETERESRRAPPDASPDRRPASLVVLIVTVADLARNCCYVTAILALPFWRSTNGDDQSPASPAAGWDNDALAFQEI